MADLQRLVAAGVIRPETRFLVTRWRITDVSRLAEVRKQQDIIAKSSGAVDLTQAAYAGLACAIGLDRMLYRGLGRRAERHRLREIAAGRWTVCPAGTSDSVDAARVAGQSVEHVTTTRFVHAGLEASQTGSYAAVHAATQAATHAVVHAATSAAGGGHGGGHGGH